MLIFLEYSKHEDPYQILCVKVLLAEEIPKKLQTLCAVKIKSESSINHVEQGEQLTTICVEDEKKWNDLFVFNCNLQQPEKSDLTITLKVCCFLYCQFGFNLFFRCVTLGLALNRDYSK